MHGFPSGIVEATKGNSGDGGDGGDSGGGGGGDSGNGGDGGGGGGGGGDGGGDGDGGGGGGGGGGEVKEVGTVGTEGTEGGGSVGPYRVCTAATEARKRGVIFDLGHGAGSFSWKVAEVCGGEGFWPNTISTDLHTDSCSAPCYDLATAMSEMHYCLMVYGLLGFLFRPLL